MKCLLTILMFLCACTSYVFGYCSAYVDQYYGCDEYIYSVQIGDIDNTGTGCSYYINYSSTYSTTMEPGISYDATVITGTERDGPYTGYYEDQVSIWVDWNQDDDFNDAGERFDSTIGSIVYSLSITPPLDAVPGITRMRVRLTYNEYPSPCSYSQYGEVEDYAVEVIASATISGCKFDDANANGVWDAGEPKLSGWDIYLDTNDNDQFDPGTDPNVVTDSNGMYFFDNLDTPAIYTVREVMQNGWTQTLPGGPDYEYTIDTDTYDPNDPYDFGNTQLAFNTVISGTIIHDNNGDMVLEPTEPKLSGWTVYADLNGNTRLDDNEPNVITDSNGEYQLTGLAPGTYIIAEVIPIEFMEGWVQTYPTDTCTYTVTLSTPDQVIENIDFGNHTFYGYGGGSGTSADPYLIYNHHHLQAVGAHPLDWSKCFKLMDNIDLSKYSGEQFNLIGSYYMPFKGTFDGDGYYIGAFTYDHTSDSSEYVGLFSHVNDPAAVIKNLTLYDTNIQGGIYTGVLVGQLRNGTIENCFVERGTVATEGIGAGGMVGTFFEGTITNCHAKIDVRNDREYGGAGGLVGDNWAGTIEDCSAEGTVFGNYGVGGLVGENSGYVTRSFALTDTAGLQYVGGLIGENQASSIDSVRYVGLVTECYAKGIITNHDNYDLYMMGNETGGLVGRNISGADIDNCYADVDIIGGRSIGGLVGVSWSIDPDEDVCTITNSYAVGSVTGTTNIYGLIANNIDSLVTDCFWDTETTGLTYSDGGTGLITAEMQDKQTYLDAGWDLMDETTNGTDDIWQLCDDTTEYPELTWNTTSLCGGGVITTFPVIADAFADEGLPDTNFGSENSLYAGMNGNSERISYVKFDISSIPDGQVIVSAKLQLNCSYLTTPAPIIGILSCSTNWEENTLTWDNKPLTTRLNLIGETIDPQTVTTGMMEWDATDIVDGDYFPFREGITSIAIIKNYNSLISDIAGFWSKDVGIPDLAPKLIVQYEPAFGGGMGTADDPFQIWTAEQMNSIGLYPNRWDRSYKLMADISMADYTGSNYNPIGDYSTSPEIGFKGVFDGNGHIISDFQGPALFNYVAWGNIQRLGLVAPNISDDGALVNLLEFSEVANCWVDGGSVSGDTTVGGLIGYMTQSSVGGCSCSADVSGSDYVGGLIGMSNGYGLSSIDNCYASGAVSGQNTVGGFVGSATETAMIHCYSTGLVNGISEVGGFCGYSEYYFHDPNNIVKGCFWDTQTSGTTQSAAGTGMPTAEMMNLPMFLNASWDFVDETTNGQSNDWAIPVGGGYPILGYQLETPPTLPVFAGGAGTASNPYLIATVEQLNSIGHNRNLIDKHFRLVNDLDMGGATFMVIANGPYAFMGTFDGDMHTIRNISIADPAIFSNVGFVGTLYGGRIFDLILDGVSVHAEYARSVGSLVGKNYSGWIDNCHCQNVDVTGLWSVGGLAGTNYWYANITASSVVGSVSESNIIDLLFTAVGGLVGENSWWSSIESSGANVVVSGGDMLGGLVGSNVIYADIIDSYAIGTITTTDDYAGGMAARSYGGDLTRCYTACEITAPAEAQAIGAIIGSERSGTYTGCFWDNQINENLAGFGSTRDTTVLIDTAGETTANMQLASTYQALGWDFNNIWDMRCEGMSYPRLKFEPTLLGDIVCPEGVEVADLMMLFNEWMADGLDTQGDIAPDGGDGIVNFYDWQRFTSAWQTSTGQFGWDQLCDMAPETPDGIIDALDLSVFTDRWLYRSAHYADIAPEGAPDGRVDLLDYALLAEDWMLGVD